ncbi:MAG TPA: polyphosphate polymerase domain-containing protein [Gemmataceae bacterium]|nr:polyphosphate polymerase domain-containing protein [Gemmataceae bacterium]
MPSHPPRPAVSPGLVRSATAVPAFEVKFLLTEAEAREMEQRLRRRLVPDPHGDPARGGAYRVTSVYFDTAAFDVYRRSQGHRRRKFRVRRYGTGPTAYLERKTKSAQQVRKRRTALPLAELARLAAEVSPDWPGAWFVRRLGLRNLRPVCRVTYERLALVGQTPDGPLRATFDRAAVGGPADGPVPDPVADGPRLLNGDVIGELKFLGAMPALFKSLVEDLRLTPGPVSKYRRCVEAAGLAPNGTGHG